MADTATKIPFQEAAAPSTPASTKVVIYAKSDGLMYSKDDAGAETLMSAGASGSVATDAIWDAAGDLAVGSGANTAAKLSIGAVGGYVSRINGAVAWNSGTSFPGAAATGDRYYRTDVDGGTPCIYDGTRWLTEQIFTMEDHVAGLAATGDVMYRAPYGGRDLWLIDIGWTYQITPTHSATHYWNLVPHKYEASGPTDTVIATIASDKASTIWTNSAATAIGALLGGLIGSGM